MSSTESAGADQSNASRQAACLQCRRSKIKCLRDPNSTVCRRCEGNGSECVIPEYHVGRYKGVKNKRTGLEKAIYQVEQAIKRSKSSGVTFDPDTDVDLRQLINQSQSLDNSQPRRQSSNDPLHKRLESTHSSTDSMNRELPEKPDEIALDNAENPLQLLAMASAMPHQSPSSIVTPSPAAATSQTGSNSVENEDADLQTFFGSLTPVLDSSPDIDPIELGLLTEEESEALFTYFYKHLSHTRWGLDPVLYTAAFVRSRSAFLFTSVLAASATFHAGTAALTKRLSAHRNRLAQRVIVKRHRSVEIVMAFMVNIPWMSPAKHWADDETCGFLSMALTLALDLQLNKIVIPSSTIRPVGFLDGVAKSDCIDATKALQLDGFPHIDPTSAWAKRLLRTRERVYLALFTLDRGVCLARGRPYSVPTGPLIDSCDTWHISDIADTWDGSIISTSVLRRDLVGLITSLRDACDKSQLGVISGTSAVKYLKDKIDRFFNQWHTVWEYQITQGDGRIPPYVEILVSHTKLSTYCSVINHATATSDVKQFFRAAGLQSALNVMRAAVEGESRLKSMPNNTVIMVSFAACFALGLSTLTDAGHRTTLSGQVRSLVEHTAQVLERIGTTPKHRNGASALFGRHIRRILRTSFPEQAAGAAVDFNQTQITPSQAHFMPPPVGPLQDSYTFDMTDDQIIEAINNASQSQELFQLDEHMFLDWLEWPNAT